MNILNPLETIRNKGSIDILFLSQGSILHFTLGQPLFIAQYSQLSSLKIPSDTHKTLPSYFLPSLFSSGAHQLLSGDEGALAGI